MASRRLLVLIVLLAALACGSPAVAQGIGSLEGEYLLSTRGLSTNTFEFTTTCENAEGNATTTVRASGMATGPYPGTFEAEISVTLGPPLVPGGAGRTVLDAVESFRIVSGDTEITGTKRLAATGLTGECVATEGPGLPVCRTTYFRTDPLVEYEATINSPAGTSTDRGVAISTAMTYQVRGCVGIGDNDQGQFSENFFLSFLLDERTLEATGGGEIRGEDGLPPVSFGFTARSDRGLLRGSCSVLDHATGTHVRCLDVASYTQIGSHAVFTGRALVDRVETTYRIDVHDNGESGIGTDTFAIQTDSGYAAAGVLSAGNVTVHESR